MSNTLTTNFSSIDYKGQNSLSSYALDLTPLRFIADIENTKDNRVVWDFGDGTTVRSLSTSKVYRYPGVYLVKLVVYDCNNNALVSTVTRNITIHDYLPYTFDIDQNDEIELKCGRIEGPYTISSQFPLYQPPSNVFYAISGSNSNNYWSIINNKFNHLENQYSLYKTQYNYAINSLQFLEIDKIEPTVTDVYARISNGSIVQCLSTATNAYKVGSTGTSQFYIKIDDIVDPIYVKFWFDKNNNTSFVNGQRVNHFNNLGITLSASVVDNPDIYDLSITSNGIDGEGYPITSFNINNIKYFNTKIPFVVKIKDLYNFSVKNFEPIELSDLSIVINKLSSFEITTEGGELLLDEFGEVLLGEYIYSLDTSYYTVSTLNYTLSSQDHGGSFRGYIEFTSTQRELLQNINISISGTFVNNQLSSYDLAGVSNRFNVYSLDYFDMYKVNEDFNPEATLKDLRFQEILLDKNVLFEDFFGGVLGNEDSDHDGIGLKQYEKIANFVGNTQDIETCEYDHLNSLAQYMGHNDENEEVYQYPEKLKRIINLASIDKYKLIGTTNKFNQNLDIRGRTSKTEYGVNIGEVIDPSTYYITAGVNIVALEKFSNEYTVLNTYQPISAIGSFNYHLSSYSSDWGWPLVLPTSFDFIDIEKYYTFFEYISAYDNTPTGGVIDFDNVKTTIETDISLNDLFSTSGVFVNMFSNTLYQSLSLIP